MNKLASMALVSMNIFLKFVDNPKEGFTAIEIQEMEKEFSGQIISIENILAAIADLFYLGYLSKGKDNKYFYDMTGRALQVEK